MRCVALRDKQTEGAHNIYRIGWTRQRSAVAIYAVIDCITVVGVRVTIISATPYPRGLTVRLYRRVLERV